jgi:hypothetical protein
VQGETREALLQEYQTYAGSKARTLDVEFIQSFDERALLWLARENSLVSGNEAVIDSLALSATMLPSRSRS